MKNNYYTLFHYLTEKSSGISDNIISINSNIEITMDLINNIINDYKIQLEEQLGEPILEIYIQSMNKL